MSTTEKTYTVVGTAINADGTIKVRWANDLVSRIKILDKAGCTEIDLIELPHSMTKLAAMEHFVTNHNGLTPSQAEVIELKIEEKTRAVKRADAAATITKNVNARVKTKAPVSPRVVKIVDQLATSEFEDSDTAEMTPA